MVARGAAALAVAELLGWTSAARGGDGADAQQLFDAGKALMAQGQFAAACPKFEESQRLDPGMGTQFHLADCWQHLGRTASAWALFREVVSEAHAAEQSRRERVAHDRTLALEPWLSKLLIRPNEGPNGGRMEVLLDGLVVPREEWNEPVAVDPGEHAIEVRRAAGPSWTTHVSVPPSTPAQAKLLQVDVPVNPVALEAPANRLDSERQFVAGPAAQPVPARPSAKGVTAMMPADVPPSIDDRGAVARAIGWSLVGAGVVGLVAGGYFGVAWLDDRSAANAHCAGPSCDANGVQLRDDEHSKALALAGTAGAGAAAAFVGVILVLSAPHAYVKMSTGPRLQLEPRVGSRERGLSLLGTW
jgi:serine/threonine-protein kinase